MLNQNQMLNYCALHEHNINYGQLYFNITVQSASSSPLEVELVDIVEMTGCKETGKKQNKQTNKQKKQMETDVKSHSDAELLCSSRKKNHYDGFLMKGYIQSTLLKQMC